MHLITSIENTIKLQMVSVYIEGFFFVVHSLSTLLQHHLTICAVTYLLMQTALANEAMDRRQSWITSSSDMSTGDEDDEKSKGVKNTTRELSKQDVIDVDDSDNSSHHSC